MFKFTVSPTGAYVCSPESAATDPRPDRWFKDGVDVNEVDISEAHW
jgi:hypothetical protein